MKLLSTFIFISLFCNNLIAQLNDRIIEIDNICIEIENNSYCQSEITIDSSKLDLEPYIVEFYRSHKNFRLSYVKYQLLKPNVILKYYYNNENLIKVAGVDRSTGITFTPYLYFENGVLIYLTHKSVDGDNSGKYFLNKSKEYLLYFLLNNKVP